MKSIKMIDNIKNNIEHIFNMFCQSPQGNNAVCILVSVQSKTFKTMFFIEGGWRQMVNGHICNDLPLCRFWFIFYENNHEDDNNNDGVVDDEEVYDVDDNED